MNDFTEALIETYVSAAAGTEQDRKDAEDEFRKTLRSGPTRTHHDVYTGRTFTITTGDLDIELLHKAYDAWYEQHGLMDLFDNNGKLINRGTYGSIKNLDRKEPAVKALLDLWGAQFKSERNIISASAKAKEEAEKENQRLWVQAKVDAIYDIVAKGVEDLKKLKDWQAIKDVFPDAELRLTKTDTDKSQSTRAFSYGQVCVDIVNVKLPVSNTLSPRTHSSASVYYGDQYNTANATVMAQDMLAASESEIADAARQCKAVKYALDMYELMTSTRDGGILKDESLNISHAYFVDKNTGAIYEACEAKLRTYDGAAGLSDGKIRILRERKPLSASNPYEKKAAVYTQDMELAGIRFDETHHDNGRGHIYGSGHAAWKSRFEQQLKATLKGEEGAVPPGDDYVPEPVDSRLTRIFDKQANLDYDIDSSD